MAIPLKRKGWAGIAIIALLVLSGIGAAGVVMNEGRSNLPSWTALRSGDELMYAVQGTLLTDGPLFIVLDNRQGTGQSTGTYEVRPPAG